MMNQSQLHVAALKYGLNKLHSSKDKLEMSQVNRILDMAIAAAGPDGQQFVAREWIVGAGDEWERRVSGHGQLEADFSDTDRDIDRAVTD